MESMQLALEYVVIAVFDGLEVSSGDLEAQPSLCAIFEGSPNNPNVLSLEVPWTIVIFIRACLHLVCRATPTSSCFEMD